jgi:hypothetical protein
MPNNLPAFKSHLFSLITVRNYLAIIKLTLVKKLIKGNPHYKVKKLSLTFLPFSGRPPHTSNRMHQFTIG